MTNSSTIYINLLEQIQYICNYVNYTTEINISQRVVWWKRYSTSLEFLCQIPA